MFKLVQHKKTETEASTTEIFGGVSFICRVGESPL